MLFRVYVPPGGGWQKIPPHPAQVVADGVIFLPCQPGEEHHHEIARERRPSAGDMLEHCGLHNLLKEGSVKEALKAVFEELEV